jgi:hypothetical protein
MIDINKEYKEGEALFFKNCNNKNSRDIDIIDLRQNIGQYSEDELELLSSECIKLHYEYGLGVCLIEDIHKLYHKIYKYGNNIPEQFEEFKINFYNGVYDKNLKELGLESGSFYYKKLYGKEA